MKFDLGAGIMLSAYDPFVNVEIIRRANVVILRYKGQVRVLDRGVEDEAFFEMEAARFQRDVDFPKVQAARRRRFRTAWRNLRAR